MLCLQTQYVLSGNLHISTIAIFSFFATLLLYSAHRLVSFSRMRNRADRARFNRIYRYRNLLIINVFTTGITCIALFFTLQRSTQLALILPAVISTGYAIPLLPQGKRFRDFGLVKIFLIAISWSVVTVILPALELNLHQNTSIIMIFLERSCFIFAIAIPFDIRDISFDTSNQVKTIPQMIGLGTAKCLGIGSLFLMLGFAWINYTFAIYTLDQWIGLVASALLTGLLIWFSNEYRSDYYFMGGLDGMLLLQLPLMFLF